MPDRQVIVDGKGTYDSYGMVMVRGWESKPPEPKTYKVDIPGGDGELDMSDFAGDTTYSNREMVFVFDVLGDFERAKTEISDLVHGRRCPFQLSWDPGYTYTGRFEITSFEEIYPGKGRLTVEVDADPYKTAGEVTFVVNAAGGIKVALPNGRHRVCPRIEVQRHALITFEGKTWELEPGTYRILDLWLHGGENEIVVNTYPEYSHATWADYVGTTWADHAGKLLSQLAAGDEPLQEPDTWADYAGRTWADFPAGTTWQELCHPAEIGEEYSAYFNYEWKDL